MWSEGLFHAQKLKELLTVTIDAVALNELKVSKALFIFCSAVTLLEDIHFHSLDFI